MKFRLILIFLLFTVSCGTKMLPQKELDFKPDNSNKSDTTDFDYSTIINDLKRQLTDSFYITTYSSFVVASNLDANETNAIISNTISKAQDCLYNDYLVKMPDEVTTILLFKEDNSYRYWAKKLFGDTDLSRFGYYKPGQKVMLMNISTGTGTLVHELTHCFVNFDFPDIPAWFNEGLGSLYERCSLSDNQILGYVNWRLPELQEAISDKSYTDLETLMNMSDNTFYGKSSSLNYSQARYLCLYLQQKRLLKKFYKTYRDKFEEDKTGIKFIKSITKSNLAKLDSDFVEWVKTLKYNP